MCPISRKGSKKGALHGLRSNRGNSAVTAGKPRGTSSPTCSAKAGRTAEAARHVQHVHVGSPCSLGCSVVAKPAIQDRPMFRARAAACICMRSEKGGGGKQIYMKKPSTGGTSCGYGTQGTKVYLERPWRGVHPSAHAGWMRAA